MGRTNPDRVHRLRHLRQPPGPGYIRVARCSDCRHMGPLPVEQLIRRFGELIPVEMAMVHLRCTACGGRKVQHQMVRLCEPSCPKQRG